MTDGLADDVVPHGEVETSAPDGVGRAATQLSVLPTPLPAPTGVQDVDAALDRLAGLAEHGGGPEEHVAVYQDVHDHLQAALTGPDDLDR